MRLINADELKEIVDEWLDSVGTVLIGKGLSYYGELVGCIEDTPTIEAELVRHGHWVNDLSADWKCSACGWNESPSQRYDYCPHCGAKMDEE